ncbi:MAG: glycosyltransferase [Ignavibacteria bacterium]|nr:glycosyltransferase [Ignavibacteria bacterium]
MNFSIITVVYNSESALEKTIKSITEQVFKDIEYIVIDGGSTDGTVDIIKKYEKSISLWISEQDKGIYDAMNKGLKKATGDYVWFLNAGDEIYSSDILSFINTLGNDADAYYGEVEYIDEDGKNLGTRTLKKPPENLSWRDLDKGMVVSHQSIIVKRDKAAYYNLHYKYCSDIDWMIRTLKNCQTIVNTKKILSKFLIGGYSKKNIIESNRERYKILRIHFSLYKVLKSHVYLSVKFLKYYFTNKKKLY